MTDIDARVVAHMDQTDGALAMFAKMIGKYYKSLIRSGIPPELAAALVADYHALHLSGGHYQNEPE